MSSFNFFEDYRRSRKGKRAIDVKGLIKLAGGFVGVLLVVYFYLFFKVSSYESQLSYLERLSSDEIFASQFAVASKLESQQDSFEVEMDYLAQLNNAVMASDTGDKALLDVLSLNKLDSVTYSRILVDQFQVTLVGVTPDISSLVTSINTLRATNVFENLKVTNISKAGNENKGYVFSCELQLRGGVKWLEKKQTAYNMTNDEKVARL